MIKNKLAIYETSVVKDSFTTGWTVKESLIVEMNLG